MNLGNHKKIFQVYIFNIFTFLLIFEILIRAIVPGSDSLINILKGVFCLVFIIYISVFKKKLDLRYFYIHLIFYVFFLIILIKLLLEDDMRTFINWLVSNNNINYIFTYVYFFILLQLKDIITYQSVLKNLKIINYIVIGISIFLFLKNDYLGMVSYENMLAYAWVGTNKTRLMSIFGNPNHAGMYFVLMLFILDYTRINQGKRFICIQNLILIVMNLLTFSRTSIIINVIYLFLRVNMIEKEIDKNVLKLLINQYKLVIISATSIVLTSILVNKFGIYFFNLKYLLTSSRWDRWKIGLNYALKNPAIGTPFNQEIIGLSTNFEVLKFSDNMFIEIGSRFGLILLGMILIYIIYLLYINFKRKNYMNLNKLQCVIISSILSGTIHFSVVVFLYVLYCVICSGTQYSKELNYMEYDND